MEKLISIIVPVLNRENTIGRCIESVLGQSYPNLELIIVDDGSTDGTLKVVDKYRAIDDRVKLIPSSRLGANHSRNDGIKIARGDYIAFLDSDDFIVPHYLRKLYEAITVNNDEVAMCLFAEVYGDKEIVSDYFKLYNEAASQYRLLRDTMYNRCKGAYCWGKLWRKDFITRMFRNLSYCEDTVFLYENLVDEEGGVALVKEVLCYYIRHEESITGVNDAGHLLDTLRASSLILHLSKKKHRQFVRPSYSLLINSAFYAYLQDKKGDERIKARLDDLCLKVIKKYRIKVLLDISSPVKTKGACVLSFFSMGVLKKVYASRGNA